MFSLDERLKGLPASKEQVVSLHQSLNAPHLAIPGRKAGQAAAFVLGLRGPTGFAVFVYLYLPDSGECAVYVPAGGAVPADKFQGEESTALGFVESMGFMMDNLNFRARPPEEQDTYLKVLPVFQREPPAPAAATTPKSSDSGLGGMKPKTQSGTKAPTFATVGKLFSAFCLCLLAAGCKHIPSEQEIEQAQSNYDLAVNALVRSPQEAFEANERALTLNPEFAEAWHVRGILMHQSFGRLEEGQAAFLKALTIKPDFSEAHTNLGNLYVDLKRYDDAIAQYQMALNNVTYTTPYMAHGNMGWAYFLKNDAKKAIEELKSSVTLNSKFCLGYAKLSKVYDAQGEYQDACKYAGRYRENCPERADAYQQEGLCQSKLGQKEAAAKSFETCVSKSGTNDDLKELCQKMKEQLAP